MNSVEKIKSLFEKVPNDFGKIRELLSSQKFTKEELADIAVACAENCFGEYSDACNPKYENFNIEDMRSNYIVEAIELLLEFGLDPNITVNNDENVMWEAMWIDAPGVAAKVLKLLLENGGNPNHYIAEEHETLFEYISFKVSEDEYTHQYFYTVQFWWLLMAYGGCWKNGEIPLEMLNGNSVEIFKDYELFDYEIECFEPFKIGNWKMHIYNIETKEKVATY